MPEFGHPNQYTSLPNGLIQVALTSTLLIHVSSFICCFRFISLFGDVKSVIPVMRRPIFNVSAISSTLYKVWKKSFDSIVEMDNLYSILVENVVVAETSDFVQPFALLLGAFFVFNIEYPKKLETTLLFFQKFILGISDRSKLPSKVLTLMSNLQKALAQP